MNPSASGWINKHFPVFKNEIAQKKYTPEQFYPQLQQSGFIYAHSVATLSYPEPAKDLKWTQEETTKINLFDALAWAYFNNHPNNTKEDFLKELIHFYQQLEKQSRWKFKFSIFKSKPEETLEKIFHQHIQTNKGIIEKNFSHLITNALLFLDVLAFQKYLKNSESPKVYLSNLETLITNLIILAFQKKKIKDNYENLVIKLLESSLRFHKIKNEQLPFSKIKLKKHSSYLERRYLLDLTSLTIYSDEEIEKSEYLFIKELGKRLDFNTTKVEDNIAQMLLFLKKHQKEITFFNYSNSIKHFYNKTNRMVKTLVLRNKNRLVKEILESKELVVLLSKSTHKDLSEAEKIKVKEQLLDICKSIPSLAIFIMPGGSVLLPILIKFIPQLLPSSFNENRIPKN
jgi:hypothetical protein